MAHLGSQTRPIFLLTDFGTRDIYAGQLRAVIQAIAPQTAVHDLTHDVTPYAIDEGAWLLEACLHVLPEDAIVVAVVDPGVGGPRRELLVESGERSFVGPDNGLLSGAFPEWMRRGERQAPPGEAGAPELRELCDPRFRRAHVSATFHGRDIFAPAAAHLSVGLDARLLGPPLAEAVLLPPFGGEPQPDGSLLGRIVHIDRYGSAITTVRAAQLFPRFELQVRGERIAEHVQTFSDARTAAPFCYAESSGYLAIGVYQGDAAGQLGLRRGEPVRVVRR